MDKFEFDEEIILKDFLRAVECQNWRNKARIILKLHPRENYKKNKERLPNDPIPFSEFCQGDIFELMAGSDLVIGAFTMLLIEARLLSFSCVSYQPSEKTFFKLPYNIKILKDYESLKNFLKAKEFLKHQSNQTDRLALMQNSTEIIKKMILKHSKP